MQVKKIMSENVAFCSVNTSLQEVARKMVECDCGALPVVEREGSKKPVGIITDRDITCRTVAEGKNPLQMKAGDCMTTGLATVAPDMSVTECCQIMANTQVRRILVVDEDGNCCGIVAQADVARYAEDNQTAGVVEGVSQPTGEPSGMS